MTTMKMNNETGACIEVNQIRCWWVPNHGSSAKDSAASRGRQ